MSEIERAKMVAHMALALVLLFERTPGFAARLHAYRAAEIDLSEINVSMDRQAVMASIGFRLREENPVA